MWDKDADGIVTKCEFTEYFKVSFLKNRFLLIIFRILVLRLMMMITFARHFAMSFYYE